MIKYDRDLNTLVYKCDICRRTWYENDETQNLEDRGIKPAQLRRNNKDYHLCSYKCYEKWDRSTPEIEENRPTLRGACLRCGSYSLNATYPDICPACYHRKEQNIIEARKKEERFILSRNVGIAIGIFAAIVSGGDWRIVIGIITYLVSSVLIYIFVGFLGK